ncbi:hypothetical protein B0H17DRAFT_872787, partial [Mycena rosella]
KILHMHAVPDALHDSKTQYCTPSCHPGTQDKVLNTLHDLLRHTSSATPNFRISGMAGLGKTAIAQN